MPVIGFDHIQLAIPEGEEDAARHFYSAVLGMSEVSKPANLSPSGCWFEAGHARLHIGVDPDFKPARKAHPALLVDNLEQMEKGLLAANCPIEATKPLLGYRRFFTTDPFGNRIEIMEKMNSPTVDC